VLRETDGAGAALADYVVGGDLLLRQERAGGESFYLPDGQMSVRLLTDAAGNVTDQYDYDAFGNLISQAGAATPNVYQYNGQQFDPNLGSYYLRARYYDPSKGRFSARDPFPGRPSDPVTLHPYLYAGNDPINRADPTGLDFSPSSAMASVASFGVLVSRTIVIPLAQLFTARVVAFGTALGVIQRTSQALGPRVAQIPQGTQQAVTNAAQWADETEELIVVYAQRISPVDTLRFLNALRVAWQNNPSVQTIVQQFNRLGGNAPRVACTVLGVLQVGGVATQIVAIAFSGEGGSAFYSDFVTAAQEQPGLAGPQNRRCLFLGG
jgi:RHS repeat-associated protein